MVLDILSPQLTHGLAKLDHIPTLGITTNCLVLQDTNLPPGLGKVWSWLPCCLGVGSGLGVVVGFSVGYGVACGVGSGFGVGVGSGVGIGVGLASCSCA